MTAVIPANAGIQSEIIPYKQGRLTDWMLAYASMARIARI